MEKQVAISDEKSRSLNNMISSETKEKIKYVKETQVVIQERIKNVEIKSDTLCKVDPEIISILNDSARNPGVKK